MPLEPEPEDFAAASCSCYLLNIEKMRNIIVSNVSCPICSSASKPLTYSMSLTDRNGIIQVLRSTGKFDYVASMRFAHLGTCPLKLAAEDHRRMVSV